jgi:hypothetical protein
MLVGPHGRYEGAVLGRWQDGLAPPVRRFLAELAPVTQELGRRLTAMLPPLGWAGLDLFVHEGEAGLQLRVAELNPRTTLGRVALGVEERVHPGAFGLWLLLRAKEVGPLASLADLLTRRHPPERRGASGRISRGVIFTTDPRGAEITTVLLVGDGRAEVRSWLQEALIADGRAEGLLACLP